jgi:hypothetical protein
MPTSRPDSRDINQTINVCGGKRMKRQSPLFIAVPALILVLLLGCADEAILGLLLDESIAAGAGTPNDNVASEPLPEARVAVRFANTTLNEAVNVQFYASSDVVEQVPDDLFADPENLVTASLGIAGTGLIEPGEKDEITLDCDENLIFGTEGGLFLDNESGDERVNGERRWVEQRALGVCGGTVTFVFTREGESFRTRLTVK